MEVSARFAAPVDEGDPTQPRQGILVVDGREWFTVLPPEAGDLREVYDAWIEQGNTPEPFAPPVPLPPRSVAMWRALTIMDLKPWGEGTLHDAVVAAIEGISDPLQKVAAKRAFERGDLYDRDGSVVPLLAALVGIDDETHDTLMIQAASLPA